MPSLSAHTAQRHADRLRVRRAFVASVGFVLLLWLCFAAQHGFDWAFLTVTPHSIPGLLGLLTAPLLHGSVEHILANSTGLLLLGTLAGTTYPKATLRALPLLWLGSGLGAWALGDADSHHLGASGLTHGLMFLLLVLGLLRRDRAAIAAGMIAFLFYGGMLLTILPHEAGVSWQSHLGGALAGVLAAFFLRRSDPQPARAQYSWEVEAEQERARAEAGFDTFETRAPSDVPVLWQRDTGVQGTGTVLPFRRRDGSATTQTPNPR
jgi:membrane associated rhomboid family serine protease